MKFFRSRQALPSSELPAQVDRRKLVLGVGVAGVAAVSAQALLRPEVVALTATDPAQAPAETGDGYQVTQHVLRYYETAKV